MHPFMDTGLHETVIPPHRLDSDLRTLEAYPCTKRPGDVRGTNSTLYLNTFISNRDSLYSRFAPESPGRDGLWVSVVSQLGHSPVGSQLAYYVAKQGPC